MCRVMPQEQNIIEIKTPKAGVEGVLILVMPTLHGHCSM